MTVPLLDPTKRFEELKETIANELNKGSTPNIMKRIDTIQRCGVSHHFEDQINEILGRDSESIAGSVDLFDTALQFRLMRQQGYNVSSDVFIKFLDKGGKFKKAFNEDMEGLISLYEAAHLGVNNEEIMSQALDYSKEQLKKSMNGCLKSQYHMLKEAENALELPRHMRMVRLEAKKFMKDCISKNDGLDSNLFEFAAMDFNSVQSLHQSEIAEIQKWWKTLGLVENLSFARDRPLECFLWTAGMFPEPCYSKCRIEVAKAVAILLVIDDVYDSYGSLEDLTLFTDAIRRWDVEAVDGLPQYMKICYMALYNTINEIAYSVLKEYGWCVIPHLQRTAISSADPENLETLNQTKKDSHRKQLKKHNTHTDLVEISTTTTESSEDGLSVVLPLDASGLALAEEMPIQIAEKKLKQNVFDALSERDEDQEEDSNNALTRDLTLKAKKLKNQEPKKREDKGGGVSRAPALKK
ncbi:putative terpene synthase 11 [Acorus calamus]|uniref:Terpene synthase 11 n=1 Tax=Acorus calamus TaxID=4465 RepID=A0AAV9DVU4_ACOCL|nr:putative terpene synthase 11 [Acorus calamus]